jgi:hypothetical protein
LETGDEEMWRRPQPSGARPTPDPFTAIRLWTPAMTPPAETWDVLLSHNRAQKPFVRELARQWRKLGLKVFFDEDTIEPGANVAAAVGRAVDGSRHVILMITPDSVASPWVALESCGAVYRDPDARLRRLIPVLLEPTDASEVPPIVRGLNWIDLTDPETRRNRYHYLLKFLGVDSKRLPDLPRIEVRDDGGPAPPGATPTPMLEDGPMPLDSPYYIDRKADRSILAHLRASGATVTVKGHQQVGKSSLLAHLHAWAVQEGRASCILSFRRLEGPALTNTADMFLEIAQIIADRLELDADPVGDWSPQLGPKKNLTRFLEKKVLAQVDGPVQLLFDEADLTFPHRDACEGLFSTLRFWHNERAGDLGDRGWRRLGMVVAHATDPALWIRDLNQSPFNVGLRVVLDDFDDDEIAVLNGRYGRPLRGKAEVSRLMKLVGGHPYLVRLALYMMATRPCTFAQLERVATDEDGPFAPHLRQLLKIVLGDAPLRAAVRSILDAGTCDDEMLFQRLWSVGLIRGETRDGVALRYQIYEDYFRKKRL